MCRPILSVGSEPRKKTTTQKIRLISGVIRVLVVLNFETHKRECVLNNVPDIEDKNVVEHLN